MKRQGPSTAGALADVSRLSFPASWTVERAREANPDEWLALRRGGRLISVVHGAWIERARAFGLGHLRLEELSTATLPVVDREATLSEARRTVREAGARAAAIDTEDGPQALLWLEDLPRPVGRRITSTQLRRALGKRRGELLKRLAAWAEEQSAELYLVGGPVRDLLRGDTVGDLDLLLAGDPERMNARARRELDARVRAHPTFRTVTWTLAEGTRIDLAAPRRERYTRPGALPRVEPGSLREDLERRDFPFNAMALALTERGRYRIVDPCGGEEDLARSAIHVLHGLSFIEDPTRILRALRLAARLSVVPTPETSRLIRVAIREGALRRLSGTRLRAELMRLLGESSHVAALRQGNRHGLLGGLVPGWRLDRCTWNALRRVEDLLAEAWQRGADARREDVVLGLLLGDLPAAERKALVEHFRPRREERRILERLETVRRMAQHVSRRGAPGAGSLHRAGGELDDAAWIAAAAGVAAPGRRRAVLDYLDRRRRLRPAIDGRDLLRAGVPAGPRLARGLAAAFAALLDGCADSREEQLRVALSGARSA